MADQISQYKPRYLSYDYLDLIKLMPIINIPIKSRMKETQGNSP